jgi:hypothetical protein
VTYSATARNDSWTQLSQQSVEQTAERKRYHCREQDINPKGCPSILDVDLRGLLQLKPPNKRIGGWNLTTSAKG